MQVVYQLLLLIHLEESFFSSRTCTTVAAAYCTAHLLSTQQSRKSLSFIFVQCFYFPKSVRHDGLSIFETFLPQHIGLSRAPCSGEAVPDDQPTDIDPSINKVYHLYQSSFIIRPRAEVEASRLAFDLAALPALPALPHGLVALLEPTMAPFPSTAYRPTSPLSPYYSWQRVLATKV